MEYSSTSKALANMKDISFKKPAFATKEIVQPKKGFEDKEIKVWSLLLNLVQVCSFRWDRQTLKMPSYFQPFLQFHLQSVELIRILATT